MRLHELAAAASAAVCLAACGGGPTSEPADVGAGSRADAGAEGAAGGAGSQGAAGAGGAAGTGSAGGSGAAGAGTGGGAAGARDGGGAAGSPAADAGASCAVPAPRFATRVVSHDLGPGQSFGQDRLPGVVLGPPRGGGCCAGSTDVCSLGHGGAVVLEAEGNAIVDGPGPDLIVFENAFWIGGDESHVYAELGRVAVSEDGVEWHTFPCDTGAAPFAGCAGVAPVWANPDTGGPDSLDPAVAGGDAFDLATVGLARARYVRVEDVDSDAAVFDLDAIALVHAACP